MTPYPDSEYPSILRGRDKRESQRLLAAAPEMLAALRNCRDWLVCITGHANLEDTERGYLEAATAAISKAEGGADETTPN